VSEKIKKRKYEEKKYIKKHAKGAKMKAESVYWHIL
jgi:hypothetical protein